MDLPMPPCAQTRTPNTFEDQDACGICGHWRCRCTTQVGRRLIATGIIRRAHGRTTRITATPTGITGSIRPAGGAR